MVTQYGMSEKLGPLAFGKKEEMVFLGREISEQRNYSDEVAAKIDAEVREIIDNAFDRAKEALTTHRAVLDRLASLLVEKETIEARGVRVAVRGRHAAALRRADAEEGSAPSPRSPRPMADVEPETDEGDAKRRRPGPAPQPA